MRSKTADGYKQARNEITEGLKNGGKIMAKAKSDKPKIDVYKEWLKISATNRPLTYYQLLRLKTFEDDINVIRKHYQELNVHVRKFASGDYLEESQGLLNELAKAMLCLTDASRKEDYDFRLGRKTETQTDSLGRRTFEDILLENRILTPDQLKKAQQFAEALGIDLEMAILQQKHATPESVMLAYAEAQGLPFVDLDEVPVDEYYAPQINPVMARQYSFIPVMSDMGKLILASPTPLSLDVENDLQMLFNMPIKSAICTPAQVNAAIAKYYPRDAVQIHVDRSREETEGGAVSAAVAQGGEDDSSSSKESKNKKDKKEKSKKPALSKEAAAKRLKYTIIAVNFTIMFLFFFKALAGEFSRQLKAMSYLSVKYLIAFGVGILIVGGITWIVNSKEIEGDDDDYDDEEDEDDSEQEDEEDKE